MRDRQTDVHVALLKLERATSKEIAEESGASLRTVQRHLTYLMQERWATRYTRFSGNNSYTWIYRGITTAEREEVQGASGHGEGA